MPKHFALLLCFITALGFSGCATRTKMPSLDKVVTFAPADTPIYLMTVTLKNDNAPRYQPELLAVNVEKKGATAKADRLNFTPDDEAEQEFEDEKQGTRYFVRLKTPPGDYDIIAFTSLCSGFPFHGVCTAPLLASLPKEAAGFVYIGHVSATVRERKGNEFRAGPVVPLIDQAATGISGGTFDISVEDRWTEDQAEFLARFPGLKNAEVRKHMLPAFNREKAQAWWEAL